jgi:hypothetical protein
MQDRLEACGFSGQVNNLGPVRTNTLNFFLAQGRAGEIFKTSYPNYGKF